MKKIAKRDLYNKLKKDKKFAWIAIQSGWERESATVYFHVKPKYEYLYFNNYHGMFIWSKAYGINDKYFKETWNKRFLLVEDESEIEPFIKNFEEEQERRKCLNAL